MEIKIDESAVIAAAQEGMDAFVELFRKHILDAIGGELNAETMPKLNADQITLLAYMTVREEVMDGGFVQLIHNGYGPFIFLNPFAKAMRQWGCKEFTNLIYDGRKLFEQYGDELTKDCTDEEFMALFEQYPEFDDLDDRFIEMEEEVTETVARYVDENIERFAEIIK
ncbi:MAG: DMP19 family protein [Bacteroidales bacterium]|nr:DMP19 family protein [Bacteroidales bacterium]